MAISDARVVRHVRCPKCLCVLQEPSGAPVYQCGGCGTNLRAKNRTGNSQEISAPSSLGSGLPPQTKHLGSSDVASTSGSTPEAPITGRQQGADMTSQQETDDFVSAMNNAPEQVVPIEEEEEEHVQSTSQQAVGNSEGSTRGDEECSARSSDGKVHLSEGRRDGSTNLQDVERTNRNGQTEVDAEGKKNSEETSQPQTADSQPAPAVLKREDDAAAAERKTTSPPHGHARQSSESLAPLQKRILKTVDDLKDDLSELFRKSPELKPRTHARPPRLPRQEGYTPRGAAMAASIAAIRARHAAVHRPGYIARAGKPGQLAAPRGLPSRRYRRCRADHPCCPDAHHGPSCHHGCCPHHSKQACTSCRGHCCRPRTQEPPALRRPPAAKEVVKRRAPPRNLCRPVLKGAPFIICSSCFKLVQVPADFAVSTKTVRKLRCGSCSTVLCYSYRDPDRKKHGDQYSTDGSQAAPRQARRDPFAFMDDFGHVDVSYSTEDEQPLHVSWNSSFNTVDETHGAAAAQATPQAQQSASLHRLMGYGSASDLLFRQHSPDLYESFSERTTPDARAQYDRKGKGVCVDFDDDGDDDSDEDCSGALRRSRLRGSGWPLPGILNKGMPAMGAIRIKS
ncbi:hypothetical protein E2562_018356 [Oryza meyeriana var. granulata]|uniref:Uncharacterized protein n=1 Tax=Oryza meyeriana var. granulata TaxID=110450 RepID=A0A6G1D6Z4_9ORYZ|nr:hypothetical protein E2562_018356 [Oryza meyeriana var. granulata]